MMGSFRRPRPRFMSSPVLSDLARFHASSPSLSNTRGYKTSRLVPDAPETEMGSFITDYFQNQLLTRGLSEVLDQVQLHSGDEQLVVLGNVWDRFFTEILPTPAGHLLPRTGIKGQELSVRQISLLAFRDLVLLKLHLQDDLRTASFVPAAVKQMLLVLASTMLPSLEFCQLERLVEVVVTPFIRDALLT
ncbi:hypothetical protein KUCAC02_035152, partial [Chaenocephalus aceratus]